MGLLTTVRPSVHNQDITGAVQAYALLKGGVPEGTVFAGKGGPDDKGSKELISTQAPAQSFTR